MISKTQPMRSAEIDLVDEVNDLDAITAQHTIDIEATAQAILDEAYARAETDSLINAKIGLGFDSTNTIAKAIGDEATTRANADTAINDKIGSGFDSTDTVAKAIGDINDKIGTGFDSTDTVAKAITDEATARADADTAIMDKLYLNTTSGLPKSFELDAANVYTIRIVLASGTTLEENEYRIGVGALNSTTVYKKVVHEDITGITCTASKTANQKAVVTFDYESSGSGVKRFVVGLA